MDLEEFGRGGLVALLMVREGLGFNEGFRGLRGFPRNPRNQQSFIMLTCSSCSPSPQGPRLRV